MYIYIYVYIYIHKYTYSEFQAAMFDYRMGNLNLMRTSVQLLLQGWRCKPTWVWAITATSQWPHWNEKNIAKNARLSKFQQTWRVKTLKHSDRKWQIHVEPISPVWFPGQILQDTLNGLASSFERYLHNWKTELETVGTAKWIKMTKKKWGRGPNFKELFWSTLQCAHCLQAATVSWWMCDQA